jgi:hypothetical protein
MNARIVRGLLLEHATRTWAFILAGLGLSLLPILIFTVGDDTSTQYEIEPVAQTMGLFIAALGLLYSAAEGDRLTCELTERTRLLPVRTWVLVSVKLVYDAFVITALSLTIHVILTFLASGPREEWWVYPVVAVTMYAVVQTLAFAAGCLGDWSLGIMFAAYLVLMSAASDYISSGADTSIIRYCAAVLALGLALSTAVIHLRRTGRWDPQKLLPRRARTAGRDRTLPPFESAFAAQRWFEIRRMQSHFAFTFLCVAVLYGLAVGFPRWTTERFMEEYTATERLYWAIGQFGMSLPFIFIVTAFLVGGQLAIQTYRLEFTPISAFFYLRPMSSGDLARARIQGTLRGLGMPFIVMVALTLALCSFWLLIDKENPSTLLTDRWGPAQLAGILALIFAGVAAAGWAAYWTINVFAAAVLYVGYFLILALMAEIGLTGGDTGGFEGVALENWFRGAFVGGGLIMCALPALAVRFGLLTLRQLAVPVVFAIAFGTSFWFATYWDDIWSTHDIAWSLRDFPQYALFALFILLPMSTIPLTLHWARHR